jgi:hypothetical protein
MHLIANLKDNMTLLSQRNHHFSNNAVRFLLTGGISIKKTAKKKMERHT